MIKQLKASSNSVLTSILGICVCLILALSLGACSSSDNADSSTAEGAYKIAQDLDKDERYEEAITKYNEVKNKHPYSKFAVESELRVADIHYKRESYIEAQTAYQLFKDFHPKNPKVDYVTFRLAMSYFNQLPPTTDRDLSPAHKAIQFFDEVVTSYPTSEYVAESKAKKIESLKMLAEKESYIGNFYFIRDKFEPALKRYEGLIKIYPDLGFDEEAMYRAGVSAHEIGNNELAIKHLKALLTKFPEGSYASSAKRRLEDYGSR